MSPWLALDSSGEQALVGIYCAQTLSVLAELRTGEPRKHAERLAPLIDEALKSANVRFSELKGIATGRGPGSFVGVRVAMSHAKGLAHALDIPLTGFCSLLAHVQNDTPFGRGVVMADARRNEIFLRAFERNQSALSALQDPETLTPDQAKSRAAEFDLVLSSIPAERPVASVHENNAPIMCKGACVEGVILQRPHEKACERTTLIPHYGRAPDAKAPVLVKTPSAAL